MLPSPKPQTPNPIVKWQGGKRRLAKHLLPMFPEHQCYVELFAGGAALFFRRDKPAKCEVINDINGDLTNLYRVVQHHFDEFVRQFEWTLTARETFTRLQSTPAEYLTDIQRAARFFYLQSTRFAGKITDKTFGTATTVKGFRAAEVESKLKAAQQRLSGVYIENEPWEKCFKRYDREHTFFYADPPYWEMAGYGVAFEWEQYQQLAQAMANAKGKVMLSINDHPDIRDLFKDFQIKPIELSYCISRDKAQKTSKELVITNYQTV